MMADRLIVGLVICCIQFASTDLYCAARSLFSFVRLLYFVAFVRGFYLGGESGIPFSFVWDFVWGIPLTPRHLPRIP